MKQSSEFKVVQKNKKPQMNADERRYFLVTDFSKIIHRKGREERKAMQQESLRPLRFLRLNRLRQTSVNFAQKGWRND